jgi:ribosomal protein S18 acetylase RimI-like enzyme
MVLNSTLADIDTIFSLYDAAIAFQKTKFDKHWKSFDRSLIEQEISENRQWKIIVDGEVACIFAITYEDPFIWGEKSGEPSIYIHRIVTNPAYRGNNFVSKIVEWARVFCRDNNKQFIRMDTWGDNQKLITYYVSCGFTYLGVITPVRTPLLPKHYEDITLSLFEIVV